MSEEISSEISWMSPAWMSPVALAAGTPGATAGDRCGDPHANATAALKRKGAKRTS